MRRIILFCFFVFALNSCIAEKSESNVVYITDDTMFKLLPPAAIEKPVEGFEQITAMYNGNTYLITAYVDADSSLLSMSFFNSLGTTMGELIYDGKNVSFVSALLPKNIKAEYIAADFQLCFYSTNDINLNFKNKNPAKDSDLAITSVFDNSGKELRTIYRNTKKIIEIVRTETSVTYTNFLRSYSYTLEGKF
ncbi:MAG: DUF3261 domain-containing protein [Spirochaetaceae bacterium]|nr:DUF3261 domain-containing protein [Spirochaetaceae bacterium]